MNDLRVTELTVMSGSRALVDNVSFTARAGEWVGIIGPNGAGKTTLLRALTGAVSSRQHSAFHVRGNVDAFGTDIFKSRHKKRARLISYSPQEPLVPSELTVNEFVALGRTPYRGAHESWFAGSANEQAELQWAISRLDLEALATRRLGTLSGGERRRAVLAQCLAQDTPIMLFDEPTTALDLGHQQALLELIDELRRERSKTVIMALHDLTLAAQYSDVVLLLSAGQVVAHGPPRDLFSGAHMAEHFGANVEIVDLNNQIAVHPVRR